MTDAQDGSRSTVEDGMTDYAFNFLASHGGPFFDLQRRLSLLHDRNLNTGRRILIFVSIAWGIPFLLTIPTLFSSTPTVWAYVSDPGPLARFLIGIACFIAAEQAVEAALRRKLGQFLRAPLIPPATQPVASAAVAKALERRDSPLPELICLGCAIVSALAAYATFNELPTTTWAASVTADTHALTAAGWWCVFISAPLFVFFFLRGVWRHLVWTGLLRDISRLDLRLVTTHPDGKSGLAFLGEYPNAYVLFVFGISCGIAAAVAKHQMQNGLSATTLTTIMAGWLVIVLAFFAYPLSAFSKPLIVVKDKTLLTLAARATILQRAAERKLIGTNIAAPDQGEADQSTETADLAKQFDQTRKASTMLLSRQVLFPVAAAALVPFAIVGASKLPYKEVISVVKKLLLV